MYYLDVIDDFDLIESVDINHNGYEVIVHGKKNNKYHQYRGKYFSQKTGKSFAAKIKDFIGIPK